MQYRWDWRIFWAPSPEGQSTYGDMIVAGLVTTLFLTCITALLAVAFGSLFGLLRSWPDARLNRLAKTWIELFRSIPLLVQLFLWYFVLPELLPEQAGNWLKALPNAPFLTAALAIGLFMSARFAVMLAAGISALPRGQLDAALALGLSLPRAYRHVVLPRVFRNLMPTLTSELINTAKNTSVALTIGVAELTARARAVQEFSFQVFEPYAVATACYLSINLVITLAMRGMERRLRVPGYLTA